MCVVFMLKENVCVLQVATDDDDDDDDDEGICRAQSVLIKCEYADECVKRSLVNLNPCAYRC